MNIEIPITKASGQQVMFSDTKLSKSLRRAGATDEQITKVIEEISTKIYPGISTRRIYKMAFNLLKKYSRNVAAKYHLKNGIMELGPSGYPFEKFIGELFRYQGYYTRVSSLEQGKCVMHEIDVIAKTDNTQLMIECKYHNQPGIICDVKIPLYIQSRFQDVEAKWKEMNASVKYRGCVVTNTRFSDDALKYGNCSGLMLIGWDYPSKGSLREKIDSLGLYPITCLTTITKSEKQYLLDHKVVLCLDLPDNYNLLIDAGVKSERLTAAKQEIVQLCNHFKKPANLQ